MEWYKVKGWKGHQGAGNGLEITLYIEARGIADALRKYKYVPSVKKGEVGRINYKQYRNTTPNICCANHEEKERIEELRKSKQSWFYFDEELR